MDIKLAGKEVAEDFIERIGDWMNDCVMAYMDNNDLSDLPKEDYDNILDDAYEIITNHFKH